MKMNIMSSCDGLWLYRRDKGDISMKKIMITGALGQIGTELVVKCREIYGTDNVLATDIREPEADSPVQNGPFEILDVTDRDRMFELVRDFEADSLMHMAALLSATAEKNPILAWDLNMGGLMNALEAARTYNLHFSHQVQLVHLETQLLKLIRHK